MKILGFLLVPLVALAAADGPRPRDATAVSQTTLPLFTPEGNRSMFFRGSAVEIAPGGHEAHMQDMQLTVYLGDAAATVDSILVAPDATVVLDREYVSGDKSVRILRDDVDAAAQKWSFDNKEKIISLAGNVRVTFKAELKDILK